VRHNLNYKSIQLDDEYYQYTNSFGHRILYT
jgi:hypothetical protein